MVIVISKNKPPPPPIQAPTAVPMPMTMLMPMPMPMPMPASGQIYMARSFTPMPLPNAINPQAQLVARPNQAVNTTRDAKEASKTPVKNSTKAKVEEDNMALEAKRMMSKLTVTVAKDLYNKQKKKGEINLKHEVELYKASIPRLRYHAVRYHFKRFLLKDQNDDNEIGTVAEDEDSQVSTSVSTSSMSKRSPTQAAKKGGTSSEAKKPKAPTKAKAFGKNNEIGTVAEDEDSQVSTSVSSSSTSKRSPTQIAKKGGTSSEAKKPKAPTKAKASGKKKHSVSKKTVSIPRTPVQTLENTDLKDRIKAARNEATIMFHNVKVTYENRKVRSGRKKNHKEKFTEIIAKMNKKYNIPEGKLKIKTIKGRFYKKSFNPMSLDAKISKQDKPEDDESIVSTSISSSRSSSKAKKSQASAKKIYDTPGMILPIPPMYIDKEKSDLKDRIEAAKNEAAIVYHNVKATSHNQGRQRAQRGKLSEIIGEMNKKYNIPEGKLKKDTIKMRIDRKSFTLTSPNPEISNQDEPEGDDSIASQASAKKICDAPVMIIPIPPMSIDKEKSNLEERLKAARNEAAITYHNVKATSHNQGKQRTQKGKLSEIIGEMNKKYNIPEGELKSDTIRRRIRDGSLTADKLAKPPIAEIEPYIAEIVFAESCDGIERYGTAQKVVDLANSLIDQTPLQAKLLEYQKKAKMKETGKIGLGWYGGFLKRHQKRSNNTTALDDDKNQTDDALPFGAEI